MTGTSYAGASGQLTFVLDVVFSGFAATLWFDADDDNNLSGGNDVRIADLTLDSSLSGFNQNYLLLV